MAGTRGHCSSPGFEWLPCASNHVYVACHFRCPAESALTVLFSWQEVMLRWDVQ